MTVELLSAKINELETNYAHLLQVLAANNIDFDLLSSTSSKKSKTHKTHKTDKTDKPKKNPSGYIIFCKQNRDKAKSILSQQQTDFKNSDIMVMLGKMWKELDTETKTTWNDKAKNITTH